MNFYVAVLVTLALAAASNAKRCDEYPKLNIILNEVLGQDKPWFVTHDQNATHKCLEYDYKPDPKKTNTVGTSTLSDKKSVTFSYSILQSDYNYTVVSQEFHDPVNAYVLSSQTKFVDGNNHIPGHICCYGCTDDGAKFLYLRCSATDRDGPGKEKANEIVAKLKEEQVEFYGGAEITDVSQNCPSTETS